MPKSCDGCGAEFSIEHALDCRFGGLVSRRHNEIHDVIGDLASLVWGNVDVSLWFVINQLRQMVL